MSKGDWESNFLTAQARRLRREKTRTRIIRWCVWPTAALAFAALMAWAIWGIR